MGRSARRWSLGQAITMTSSGLVLVMLVAFGAGYVGLRRAYDRRTADRLRFEQETAAAAALLTAFVDQEVGLRGYLSGGSRDFLEPLQHGQIDEAQAWTQLRGSADPDEQHAIDGLALAVAAWHRTIVDPELVRRAQAPLDDLITALRDGKRMFDQVRARHTDLAETIRANDADRIGDDDQAITRLHLMVAVIAILALVIAFVATRYVLRHTAAPLAELARRAEAGEPFPAPDESPIREVHTLASSLYQLDATVFVREQALAAAHDEAVALTRFGAHVQQLSDEDELHDAFVRSCQDLLSPSKVQVMVRNPSKNRLEVVRPAMPPDEQLTHPILVEPLKCRAVRTLREVGADAGDATACPCPLGVPETGSHLCLPMLAAGELVGVTNLQSAQPGHFTPDRVRAVQGYAGFTSATLSSLRLIAATRERALRDGLTGAYNRAFLSEYMTKALASARRRTANVAVLMIDLDHFKRINDEHGHQVGDAAIVALARCLQAQTRTNDAVVRYGGEEFCVLLVDVGADAAAATAERIRAAIERAGVLDHGPILRASIGLALFPEHAADEQGLIAAADAALYRAKGAGRNRVELARAPA